MLNILWRNIKWRYQNPLSIAFTILQPLIWLTLYSAVAGQALTGMGFENYTAFILPGIMVLVTFASCSSGGFINFIMKKNGSFYRILIAPVSRFSIVMGQILESVILSFIEAGILCLVALFFSVNFASGFAGILLMIPLIFMTGFFMSSLAYSISLILPNEMLYETIMNAIVLPVFFLSSALFPVENLSGGLKIAIMINPFSHMINTLRNLIMYQNIDFVNVFSVIGLFLILCLISYLFAVWRLKKLTSH